MIHFRLNAQSGVATYVQLVQQVRHALRSGLLEPGDQLPTVKEVVGSLAINPNTVLKAYRELEHAGLVEGRPGMGTFVLRSLEGPPPDKQAALRKALQRWLQSAFEAGLSPDAVLAFVDAAMRDVTQDSVA
jgi:GntR family transcriptional regulator